MSGADGQNRTGDLLITNQLLCRLSYIGVQLPKEMSYLSYGGHLVKLYIIVKLPQILT